MTSPMHQHTRTTSSHLSMKRPQNKAAAQRLAEMMAQQPADDEEEKDELYDFSSGGPSAGIGLAGGRQARSSSPMVRNLAWLPICMIKHQLFCNFISLCISYEYNA